MPDHAFWLYLECGHRVKWHESSEGDRLPTQVPCPEAHVVNHGIQPVYRAEWIEEPRVRFEPALDMLDAIVDLTPRLGVVDVVAVGQAIGRGDDEVAQQTSWLLVQGYVERAGQSFVRLTEAGQATAGRRKRPGRVRP
jgi:hypothetical protein